MLLLLFIPIGITVNLAEKIDKILENEVPFIEVVYYYIDFTIYFANLLFPLFLLQSQLISKMSRNEKITDADLKKLEEVQKKLDFMIKGGAFEQSAKF